MQLTYYNNQTDERYIDKQIALLVKEGHPNPVNIIIVDDTNIVRPTFRMADVDLYATANYVYVDELRRYYFIESYDLSQGFAYLHCRIDTRSTYKRLIRSQSCIIKRQEHNYDMYQNDGELPVKQYPAKRCIGHFESPFNMERVSFVMGVVGATDKEESEGE